MEIEGRVSTKIVDPLSLSIIAEVPVTIWRLFCGCRCRFWCRCLSESTSNLGAGAGAVRVQRRFLFRLESTGGLGTTAAGVGPVPVTVYRQLSRLCRCRFRMPYSVPVPVRVYRRLGCRYSCRILCRRGATLVAIGVSVFLGAGFGQHLPAYMVLIF